MATGIVVRDAVDGDRSTVLETDGDILGVDLDRGIPGPHAHDRLDGLQRDVQALERLGLVGGTPDVGVRGIRLLLAVAVRQAVGGEPLAHLRAPAELGHEVGIEPRLVDAQVRVGQQAVAIEPLDVVALEGRAVAPDVDVIVVHRPDQQGAGHRPAERRGVEVHATAGTDVEGATGQGRQSFLDQLLPAIDDAGKLRPIFPCTCRDAAHVRLVVLADVGGVGARHGALGTHPGDGDRRVEAAGEGDADALADGQ